jgi:FAD/FMN-containing dehydrogenase
MGEEAREVTSLETALRAWRSILGEAGVLSRQAAADAYGASTTGAERTFLAALRPTDRDQVQRLVEISARERVPLYPISTGHNWGYGCALPAREGCVLLDLSALQRILDFDPELGTVTVEPGVTQGMLAAFLERERQPFLVPVTGAGPTCSLVGNALERGYGITPIADHFGAVLSLEAVLPDGRVYRRAFADHGGTAVDRAFKWGVGPYLDGLFTQGGFGVVTNMTIGLARRPEAVKAFVFGVEGDHLDRLVTDVRAILGRFPGAVGGINLMNAHRVLAMAAPYPREAIGADGLIAEATVRELARYHQVTAWTAFGTLYGTKRVVRAVAAEVKSLVRGYATRLVVVSPEGAARLVRFAELLPGASGRALARRARLLASGLELVDGRPNETALPLAYWKGGQLPPPGAARDPARDGCGLIWYAPLVPMKSELVQRYVAFVTRVMREHRLEPLITLTTLSERCFDSSVPLLFDRRSSSETEAAQRCYRALLDEGRKLGFLPYRVALQGMEWLTSVPSTYWDVVAALKERLDPAGILAPGRYTRS